MPGFPERNTLWHGTHGSEERLTGLGRRGPCHRRRLPG